MGSEIIREASRVRRRRKRLAGDFFSARRRYNHGRSNTSPSRPPLHSATPACGGAAARARLRRRRGIPAMAVRLSSNFVLRKLHQLSGIVPLGAFLLEHLYTNSKAVHPTLGERQFNEAVADLQEIPYIIFVEIGFIFIPLIYHAVFGLFITWESRPNNLS